MKSWLRCILIVNFRVRNKIPKIPNAHQVILKFFRKQNIKGYRKRESKGSRFFCFVDEAQYMFQMTIINMIHRSAEIIDQLTQLWERSVKATHMFLRDEDIAEIKKFVPGALCEVSHLICCVNDDAMPIGFMGIEDKRIEMLFISPKARGKGIGRALIDFAVDNFSIEEVTVTEQNIQAVGFYERIGFSVYKRSDYDEQGRPFPLLYMRLGGR